MQFQLISIKIGTYLFIVTTMKNEKKDKNKNMTGYEYVMTIIHMSYGSAKFQFEDITFLNAITSYGFSILSSFSSIWNAYLDVRLSFLHLSMQDPMLMLHYSGWFVASIYIFVVKFAIGKVIKLRTNKHYNTYLRSENRSITRMPSSFWLMIDSIVCRIKCCEFNKANEANKRMESKIYIKWFKNQ